MDKEQRPNLTILLLTADPSDAARLRLDQEHREIREKLQLAKMRDQFTLEIRTSVRPEDLTQAIFDTEPQIVHFSGHGTSSGELCLEDKFGRIRTVSPDALASLFELVVAQVQCVVLNACYSKVQAEAIASHIDYVIGMKNEINDEAAIIFATGFYKALGAGRLIEEAYKFGLVELKLMDIPEHLIPVLIRRRDCAPRPEAPSRDGPRAKPLSTENRRERHITRNVFRCGSAVQLDSFYGRRKQRAEIREQISSNSRRCISVSGKRRTGKTSLLWYIRDHPSEFCRPDEQPLVFYTDLVPGGQYTQDRVFHCLRRGIEKEIGKAPWLRDESEVASAVTSTLLHLRNSGYRPILLIDELEFLGFDSNHALEFGQYWQARIAEDACIVIAATVRPLSSVYESWNITSPFQDPFNVTTLGALEDAEWQRLVREGFAVADVEASDADLELIYDLAGGLPYLTQLVSWLLLGLGDHEQTRKDFAVQAARHFEYLWSASEVERNALRYAAGMPRLRPPDESLRLELQRQGLLRPDGSIFSSAFASFIQGR